MSPDPWDRDSHRVHPRWVWGGLAAAMAGLVALGTGVMLLSLPLSIAGAALLAGGGLASLRGGIMNDAGSGADPADELEQVREGDVHEGTYPGETVEDESARRNAGETARAVRARLEAGPRVQAPIAPVAGWLLLGLSAFVVISQPWFIDNSAVGRDAALRDGGLAIVVGLVGLWVATESGPLRAALVLSAMAGLGFVGAGLLAEHAYARTAGLEVVVGLLVASASVAGVARPSPSVTPRRHRGRPARSSRSSGRRRPA